MKNKTCVECRYMLHKDTFEVCTLCMTDTSMFDEACKYFAPPTNGDVIRQGGDKRLITFATEWSCFHCFYRNGIENKCEKPEGKDCFDGMLAWLNAPAESEVKDE